MNQFSGRSSLPVPPASLIGREQELEDIHSLLNIAPLVTITGAGGCGKTRLALWLAQDLVQNRADLFTDGVWWCDLNSLSDPEQVPAAVAAIFHVSEPAQGTLTQNLAEALKPQSVLLLLDGCEHLQSACLALADAILRNCPQGKLLCTSLVPLGHPLEKVFTLLPLAVPVRDRDTHLSAFMQNPSVRVFVECARQVLPDFHVTRQNSAEVAQICFRLEGLPLALELAARRIKMLSTAQIADRLDNMLALLSRGAPGMLSRHQTLRATLDWSYQLLDDAEKHLLRSLSVFPASFTLEMVEAVCGESIKGVTVMDLISSLAEKSLLMIISHEEPLPVRYRLLETIRQYAREQLEATGETPALRSRLLHWCVDYSEKIAGHLIGDNQAVWMEALGKEQDHFRGSLRWAITSRQIESGMLLARSLWRYWLIQGHWREGRAWCEELLALHDELQSTHTPSVEIPVALKTRLLYCAGTLAFRQNDWKAAMAYGEESLKLALAAESHEGQSRALNLVALTASEQGNYSQAINWMEQALEINRLLGDNQGIATLLNNLGSVYQEHLCNFSKASEYYRESLGISQRLGDKGLTETYNLGSMAAAQGYFAEAKSLLTHSLQLAIQDGDAYIQTMSQAGLGDIALQEGQLQEAEKILLECYQLRRQAGEQLKAAYTLRQLGVVAAEQGDFDGATQKMGQSLAQARELQDAWGMGAAFIEMARLDIKQNRFETAYYHALEGLRDFQKCNSRPGQVSALEVLAQAAAHQGQLDTAARWLGVVERERGEMNTPRPPIERPPYDRVLHRLESCLGKQKFHACLTEGRTMRLKLAVQQALRGIDAPILEPSPERGTEETSQVLELSIYALGESRVEVNRRAISPSDWLYTKAKELLYYLLIHPPVTKEQIGLDLWPDASTTQLRAIFHRVLHELRRVLADPKWIVYEEGRYRFNPSPSCWFDLAEFERRLAQTKPTRPNAARTPQERSAAARILLEAVNLWRGDFLQDLDAGEWAILYRENVRQEYIYALIDMGQIHFTEARYSAAADAYRRVLALDEYMELGHRELMRCHARMGETGQALRQYQQLSKLLQDELDAVPSHETTLLYERLRRGEDV